MPSSTEGRRSGSLRSVLAVVSNITRAGIVRRMRRKGLLRARDLEDVVVVSYPKSGRTWLRVMLDHLDVDVRYDHDIANYAYNPPADGREVDYDFDAYRDRKVLYLIRDPRDVVVSSYHHATKREKVFEGDISAFIRDPALGIGAIVAFQTTWLRHRDVPAAFQLAEYEAMHERPVETLQEVLDFFGVTGISTRRLRRTVDLFHFRNMQNLERRGVFRLRYGRRLKPGDPGNPDSFKVRRGKVGGYSRELSEADIAYCDAVIRESGLEGLLNDARD